MSDIPTVKTVFKCSLYILNVSKQTYVFVVFIQIHSLVILQIIYLIDVWTLQV